MNKPTAIFDTSVLISLYCLERNKEETKFELQYLSLVYNKILIPEKVEKEFLSPEQNNDLEKYWFIEKLYATPIFEKCIDYERDIVNLYYNPKEGIHYGEAEVFAQQQSFEQIPDIFVVLDDKMARKLAINKKIKFNGTLKILALIDLRIQLGKYFEWSDFLRETCQRYLSREIINQVWDETKHEI